MDIFALRDKLVEDYNEYTRSFIKIGDPRIERFVTEELNAGAFWPEPLIQLNPSFECGGTIDDLVERGILHPKCSEIFRLGKSDEDPLGKQLRLYCHQRDAILKARESRSYVLTSGTGSGKSLTYIVPIVSHVLHRGSGKGIQAIVVYPMNALANSQAEELSKYLQKVYPERLPPVRFARYTGQERGAEREQIRTNPPDILLTNYMMLELLLTRREDAGLVEAARALRFLVFDELHTYRGRQGADVAMLIRRCRLAFGAEDIVCVGTSATMASEGTSEDQKQHVAQVAQKLFGVPFTSDQIIGEALERATRELDFNAPDVIAQLRHAIETDAEAPDDTDSFCSHPLSSWIESAFGIRTESETGRLVRQAPRRLLGGDGAAEALARITSMDSSRCAHVIRRFLLKGSQIYRSASSRFPVFAFRLHQFFTRGDTVWTTIEPEDQRHLELSKKISKPGEPQKLLFPLVFCRHCGAAYYRVKVAKDEHGRRLLPREDRQEEDEHLTIPGYLFISSQRPWPSTVGPEMLERLPDFMKEWTVEETERLARDAKKDLPEPVFVDASGRIVSEGEGLDAAFIQGHFPFCLHCGVAYTRHQRAERTKLATLGVDNRSTATTILAIRALIELQGDVQLRREARKLLSFTDNRQDASLQAGHFNDFAQVALLRSGLFKALETAGAPSTLNPGPNRTAAREGRSPEGFHSAGLKHYQLSRYVLDAMGLPFEEYASDPDVRGPGRQTTEDALRRVIEYFLYRDLQRGWRVTAPNLEECGLLRFDYEGLTGDESLLAEKDLWESGFTIRTTSKDSTFIPTPEPLRSLSADVREEILRTLLDVLRRSLAIKVDVLNPSKQHDLVEQTRSRLREDTVWYLDDPRDLVKATVAYPRPQRKGKRRDDPYGLFVSSYGAFGRYVKRTLNRNAPGIRLGRAEIDEIIGFLFLGLRRYGIVEQVRGDRDGEDPGYQINPDAVRWLPGTGAIRPIDRTRLAEAGEVPPEVNRYFVECYRRFVDLKCLLEAREHTAQVDAELRKDREDRFRSGRLPLLFCSPTMELGVDIADLNVVNLRNVPPTPANYAQRSGRAGRGGEPALVYTYCAGRSPHDQYFFREPEQMVAGVVAPPRIDIANRDLIRSHIHAVWMEIAKPDLGRTLTQVLDLRPEDGGLPLPIQEAILEVLRNLRYRSQALERAQRLVWSIREELSASPWFHENWVKDILDQLEKSFDTACDRWRSLYRAAVRQRELHHRIIGDHSRPENERDHSRRLRAQAESQIRLLTEAEGLYEGDFYSYRYFATEGFLPGYNFPRLPISAYIPGRRKREGRDEFVSRPRFLAISEFGPRALIYHEGARYRVYKANLDFGSDDVEATHSLATAVMKRCAGCGYAHMEQGLAFAEICERCGTTLDRSACIENLVYMQNVSLQPAQRITCDEEERQRLGYRIVTAYRFPEVGGRLDRRDAEIWCDGDLILRLSYGDAADLFRINLGWSNQRRNQRVGFDLDLERGYWSRNQADAEDADNPLTPGRVQRVVPYIRDTKNALVMSFDPPPGMLEMAGLQAAFKEAVQKYFQIEPRELGCEPLPDADNRREILFYEASEGGAGVLRQIVDDPSVFPALARTALEICHFDPVTLEDKASNTCGQACYACLLDYGNQPDHRYLDRYLIRDFLARLTAAQCRPSGGVGSREERLAALRKRCDSALEKKWLDMLDKLLLNPPSDAQVLIEACHTRPDFFYADTNAAIYIDGPPHDDPAQIREDEAVTQRLMEHGYIVIRFHHKDDWTEIFRRHPDIFGRIGS